MLGCSTRHFIQTIARNGIPKSTARMATAVAVAKRQGKLFDQLSWRLVVAREEGAH